MKIQIKVTAEDIKDGGICICNMCPIALAIKKLVHGYVEVCKDFVRIYENYDDNGNYKRMYQYPLPKVAGEFVTNFDCMRAVAPFSFDLNVSKKILKRFDI